MSGDDLLIERAHDVFDAEYRRLLPQGCSEAADHDEAVQSAIAAVVALVQGEWSGAARRERGQDDMSPMLMMLSRAVRRVPLDWKHPRDEHGYRPLLDGDYAKNAAEWDADKAAWDRGEFPDYASEESRKLSYEEWAAARPDEADYMPTFPADAVLGICMYEEVTEGTPISAVFPDTDEGRVCMASYLAATPRGIESGMTDADWLAIINGGIGTKDIHTGEVEVR